MFRIGDSLRDARMRQGLDLADVERRTKIRARYLVALEEEQFELIPGQAYAKGFLRAYSETLSLDSKPLLEEFDERCADGDEEILVSLEEVDTGDRRLPGLTVPAGLVAVALILAVIVLAASLLREGGSRMSVPGAGPGPREQATFPGGSPSRPALHQSRPAGKRQTLEPVVLEAVSAWDPDGDGYDHDGEGRLATDGDPATFWRTETYYAGLKKRGVGLVVATASPTRLARYYLVWITGFDRVAHVDELRAYRRE